MPSVEVLREIKAAEKEAERLRAQAKQEAEGILRDAAREAEARKKKAEEEADRTYADGIKAAEAEAERETRQVLQQGESDAKHIASRGSGPALDAAVDILLKKFDQRVRD